MVQLLEYEPHKNSQRRYERPGPAREMEILMQPHVTLIASGIQTIEQWLPVVGYEGFYDVSDQGQVRGVKRVDSIGRPRNQRLLRPAMSNGYPYVNLHKNAGSVLRRIHALVAEAFIGPRPDDYTVNHIDGNKQNNCVRNLEYLTQRDNIHHSVRTGLRGKLREEQVWEIREMHSRNPKLPLWASAKRFGVSRSTVASILRAEVYGSVPNRDGSAAERIPVARRLNGAEVYDLCAAGYSLNAIARMYGMNVSSVSRAYHKIADRLVNSVSD